VKISLGTDERTALVDFVLQDLAKSGHTVAYYGPDTAGSPSSEATVWPAVARDVAGDVAEGRAQEGILFCWTGTGVSIAANKVHGIRAALCADAETARGARLWNNANVLCLSLRTLSQPVAQEILQAWFSTTYIPNPSDDASLKLVDELDQDGRTVSN